MLWPRARRHARLSPARSRWHTAERITQSDNSPRGEPRGIPTRGVGASTKASWRRCAKQVGVTRRLPMPERWTAESGEVPGRPVVAWG